MSNNSQSICYKISLTQLILHDHHSYYPTNKSITFLLITITNNNKVTTTIAMTNYPRKDNNIRPNINKCKTTNSLLRMLKWRQKGKRMKIKILPLFLLPLGIMLLVLVRLVLFSHMLLWRCSLWEHPTLKSLLPKVLKKLLPKVRRILVVNGNL